MPNLVYIATSLNGYIADRAGGLVFFKLFQSLREMALDMLSS